MAMLDTRTQRFREKDGVLQKKSVAMRTPQPAERVRDPRVTEIRMHVNFVRTPGTVEKVFRTGPMQGAGPRFPVDEPHIVPFSVPDRSGVIDIVIDPDESPFSFQFREQIVELIGDIVSRRCDNSPFGFPSAGCTPVSSLFHQA
jgi:hypothetical protein